MNQLNLFICSLREAESVLSWETEYNVVSIRDATPPRKISFDNKEENYRSIVRVHFDDIWSYDHQGFGFIAPKLEDIQRILDWSKGRDNFLVHCYAGVSRSAAVAYLIACSRMDPREAIRFLCRTHSPNELIIRLGTKLLNNQEVYDEYEKFCL